MTAWLKILLVLVLGGILSTLGDRLGTKVGKARLSIFKLRPKSTAVLITVFTGSIISAISFATMVVFDRDLRVGLFQLEDIREKIIESETELKKLEKNLYALRSGNVVISSGQSLATATLKLDVPSQAKQVVSSSAARLKASTETDEEVETEELVPLVQEADPEFEKLLDEEEQIAKLTNSKNQTPTFRPGEAD